MDNHTIAQRLTCYAHELETTDPNRYRIRAYRRAAEVVLALERPVKEIVAERGRPGLAATPGIGAHLAFTIAELVRTGELRTWEQNPKARRGQASQPVRRRLDYGLKLLAPTG